MPFNLKHLYFLSLLSLGLARKSYVDYQVVRVPNTEKVSSLLSKENMDILSHNVEGTDILLPPNRLEWFQKNFDQFQVLNPNLQDALDEELKSLESFSVADAEADYFASYHRFDDMVAWYKQLAEKHPDFVTFIPSIGKTVEGRDIIALKVTTETLTISDSPAQKPQIWIQGQIHAREWISGITVQYLIEQLISNYMKDKDATKILDLAEIVVVPIQNPDGYEYTWTEDRMWRKNRNGEGVDLNRNWDDHWGGPGSSGNPESEIYRGESPFSELETKAVSSFMLKNKNIVGALDIHSYSELLLRPSGWTNKDLPFDGKHKELGAAITKAIQNEGRGTRYRNIKVSELYLASGGASDWFFGEAVFKNQGFRPYSYSFELSPGVDRTGQGFILPPEKIVPVGKEFYAAFKVFALEAIAHPLKE